MKADGQTFKLLMEFSERLGWPRLRECSHCLPAEVATKLALKKVVWYEVGADNDCFLQINKFGGWQAAVYAIKYRIYSGRHHFRLRRSADGMQEEAERRSDWLARDWFSTTRKRAEYRALHPECT